MTKRRFDGQVVMITGAAGGFGSAAAHRFAAEGARLVLSDLDKRGLEHLAEKLEEQYGSNINFTFQAIDITSESDVAAHIEHGRATFGKIDIGVNNAGIGQPMIPLHETTLDTFERVMAVNGRAVFLCMKHQLAHMIPRRAGTILNVASAAGLVGAGQIAPYAASKHAVVGLTRSAADEVARHGIRVNALCPSFAPTNLFNEIADGLGARKGLDRDAAYDAITTRIPMRRVATIDEVVQAMLWACDPENSFMTGQAISIDGGLTAV